MGLERLERIRGGVHRPQNVDEVCGHLRRARPARTRTRSRFQYVVKFHRDAHGRIFEALHCPPALRRPSRIAAVAADG